MNNLNTYCNSHSINAVINQNRNSQLKIRGNVTKTTLDNEGDCMVCYLKSLKEGYFALIMNFLSVG
jgi:translation initiation factor 2B subunit (eIF-2B alpha/beta/delta family)